MALCASAHQPLAIGAILGVLGAIAGAFAGYEIRHRLVEAFWASGLWRGVRRRYRRHRLRFTDRLPYVLATALLLPNPIMPASVAHSHFWETLGFSLLFGSLAGWLMSNPHKQEHRAA